MSFVELEKILGFTLPNSARTYDMWWQNGGHTQAYAWMNAGYMVTHFDLRNEVVEDKAFDILQQSLIFKDQNYSFENVEI